MPITESIKEAQKREASGNQILKEIIKQNPNKKAALEDALKKGFTPAQLLNEIIKRDTPSTPQPAPLPPSNVISVDMEEKIQQAKERIEALKKKTGKENFTNLKEKQIKNMPMPNPIPPLNPQETGEQKENKEKEEIRRTILERLKESPGRVTEKPMEENLEGNEKPFTPLSSTPQKTAPAPEIKITAPLPKKPTLWEKLWVRIVIFLLIIVFLMGNLTFWYWYFRIRIQSPNPPPSENPTPTPTPSPEPSPEPGITIPPSLFQTDIENRTIKISKSEELPANLQQVIQETLPETNQFQRVIVENTTDKKILGLKDFLTSLLIRMPNDLYQKLNDDFTLFIFSQREGNRMGFVAEIKDYEGLTNLLRDQEATLETDLQPLFALMGKKDVALVSYFRNAANVGGYSGPDFRYKTLTGQDLGICYLVSGDYFVLTSSWQSMEKIVEKLKLAKERTELTIDLKIGDRGYEVEILQKWLAQDSTIYIGKATGYFGTATQQAVIKFQKKYENEILTPQGKTEGTGIVDEYTRMKLNELYGESGIKPTITELKKPLQYGAWGQDVKLLQTWLSQDRDLYPPGIKTFIVSGYFGPITKNSVILFQKKYSLNEGAGVVDVQTLQKLNDLYSK